MEHNKCQPTLNQMGIINLSERKEKQRECFHLFSIMSHRQCPSVPQYPIKLWLLCLLYVLLQHQPFQIYPGFALIGQAPTLLCSHWCSHSVAMSAFLCHKEPAQGGIYSLSMVLYGIRVASMHGKVLLGVCLYGIIELIPIGISAS